MKAATHTEIYRPFRGELRERGLRAWPLVVAGVRTATKRKLPLLLLFGVPAIATVVFSFVVYAKYTAEAAMGSMPGGGFGEGLQAGMAAIVARRAAQQLAVANQILMFHSGMLWFALLVTAWFGSGLFSEDRRAGAHQLYFSRPLTRLDYFLGKFLVVAFFASLAQLVPGLVLCVVAAFSSPEWSFLTDQYDVVFETLAFASLWIAVTALASLAASSLASRRVFALVGLFALFVLSSGFATLLGEQVDPAFFAFSPVIDVYVVGRELFGVVGDAEIPVGASFGTSLSALVGLIVLFLAIIAWRLRRLEVVA